MWSVVSKVRARFDDVMLEGQPSCLTFFELLKLIANELFYSNFIPKYIIVIFSHGNANK